MIQIMLNNLRVKKEFLDVFYCNINSIIKNKTSKIINKELHETLGTLRDNFKNINDIQSKRTYYILSKEYERYQCRIEIQNLPDTFFKLTKYILLTFYKVFTGYDNHLLICLV